MRMDQDVLHTIGPLNTPGSFTTLETASSLGDSVAKSGKMFEETRINDRSGTLNASQSTVIRWITRTLLTLWCLVMILFWVAYVMSSLRSYGLFGKVAGDYGAFWAAGRAFIHTGPGSVYDIATINHFAEPLLKFHGTLGGPGEVPPGLYPPPFFALLAPFALLPPVASFLIWTLVQFALALYVVVKLTQRFEQPSPILALALLFFFPLPLSLYFGQAMGVLLFAWYQAYVAFEHGQDTRAGLWLGVFLLKPQYLVVFPLVLAYKRRRRALVSLSGIVCALGLLSLIMLGPDGVRSYLRLSSIYTSFHTTHTNVRPEHMMNWHSVLINLFPTMSESVGNSLTWALMFASLGLLPLIWKGSWNPTSRGFPNQMLATMVIALIASSHSYVHGAVLLLVPGVTIMARGCQSWTLRTTIRAGFIVIPLLHFGLMMATQRDLYKILVPLAAVALCVIATATILIRARFRESIVVERPHVPMLDPVPAQAGSQSV